MTELSLTCFKRCSKCRCTKPITPTHYGRNRLTADGLNYHCKTCKKLSDAESHRKSRSTRLEAMRVYREDNRQALAYYQQLYRQENAEQLLEYSRLYYEQNRDSLLGKQRTKRLNESPEDRAKRREYNRQYLLANKETIAQKKRDYRANNPELVREQQRRSVKKNPEAKREASRRYYAYKRNAECEPYTEGDLNEMWHKQGGCCAYCDLPIFDAYHVDHVLALSRGGADKLENIVLACPTCNLRKGAKPVEEFLSTLQKEVEMKLKRIREDLG